MSDAASKPGAAGAPNATGAGGVAPQPNTTTAGAASGGGGSSALARAPSPPAVPSGSLRVVLAWLLDQLAAQLAARLRTMEERERDPNWGMVSQKTLPAWIHADAYVDACRAGRVEGARLWRRQWIARREAVERWWTAESRPPAPDGGDDDSESVDAILEANGIERARGVR